MKKLRIKEKIGRLSKKKKILIAIGILVLIGVIVFFARGGVDRQADDEEMMMETTTAAAERMNIRKTVSSNGEITSSLEEKLVPHASYKLEKIKVVKGEEIKEGSPILFYTNGTSMDAPYDLVVKDWNLPDENETLTNDHSIEVAGTDVLKVSLSVNEDNVMLVKKGQPATIKVKATGKTYKGEVSFVSDVGEYSGGTSDFPIQVIFHNDGDIKLGMNGKAKVVIAEAKNVIGVPIDAVTEDGETGYVTVQKDNGKEEDVEVTTGISNKNYIEIKDGLKEGDTVVITTFEEDYGEEYMEYR